MNKPTARDLEALMEMFEKSDWKELDLRMEGFELYLSKDPTRRRSGASVAHVPAVSASVASAPAPVIAASTPAAAVPAHWIAVKAPNLGTFYRAPKPGAAPYVQIGQTVTPCLKRWTTDERSSVAIRKSPCLATLDEKSGKASCNRRLFGAARALSLPCGPC